MFDIRKADKAEILMRLYNGCSNVGMGLDLGLERFLFLIQAQDRLPKMDIEKARSMIQECQSRELFFDYINGKSMKVRIGGNTFDETSYDRETEPGNAQRVLEGMPHVYFMDETYHIISNVLDS